MLTAAITAVTGAVGPWLAGQVLDESANFARRWWRKRQLEKQITEKLSQTFADVFRVYPQLSRVEAYTELEPVLRTQIEQLLSPSGEWDFVAIGEAICSGCPVDAPNSKDVGSLFAHQLHLNLVTVQELQPFLTLVHTIATRQFIEGMFGDASEAPALAQVPEPLPSEERESVEAAANDFSPSLLEWSQLLPTGEWIDRPELDTIEARIDGESSSVSILLGVPGSGKSALLARIGNRYLENGTCNVIAIRADQVPHEVADDLSLGKFLGFEHGATETIKRLSVDNKVVVLLDQLDSVSDLVDLRSQRLNVLLNLVSKLSGGDGAHIVCSSRAFEFQHDPRLSSLEGQEITLQLPDWDVVAQIMSEHGIDTESWPADRRDALRAPQVLTVFLSIASEVSPDAVNSSYVGMLDQFWDVFLLDSGARSITEQIAMDMADEESLYLASARYAARADDLADAINSGVLRRDPRTGQIHFKHQTFFDHALARGFLRDQSSLGEYAITHQDSLFPRPRLWSLLTYLRDADPNTYRREVQWMQAQSSLRLHIQYLLIDFIGSRSNLEDWERRYIRSCLEGEDLRMKAARAIGGSEVWFSAFSDNAIPDLMLASVGSTPLAAIHLLRLALPFARNKVLALIQERWSSAEHGYYIYMVTNYLQNWDDNAVNVVRPLAESVEVSDSTICDLATLIAAHLPEHAAEFVSDRLQWSTNLLSSEENGGVEKMFNQGSNWYQLPAIAEAAPSKFVQECEHWFLGTMASLTYGESSRTAYLHSKIFSGFRSGEEEELKSDLLAAVSTALSKFAEAEPEQMWAQTAEWRASDVDLVQQIYAHALLSLTQDRPDLAIQYLLEDDRRFTCGRGGNPFKESRQLIRTICENADDTQIQRMFGAVQNWSRRNVDDKDDAESRRNTLRWNRFSRFNLLTAFHTRRLTQDQSRLVEEERRAFPDDDPDDADDDWSAEMTLVRGRMNAHQMAAASDDEVLNAILETPDHAGDVDSRRNIGGARQLSQEFIEFAKENSERALRILHQLPTDTHASYVLGGINALGGVSDVFDEVYYAFAQDMIDRGCDSRAVAIEMAGASLSRIKHPTGAPQHVIDIYERNLADGDESLGLDESDANKDNEVGREPILWGHGRLMIMPYENYPLLRAIWWGYVLRDPTQVDRALSVLNQHLDRREGVRIWNHILLDLKYLHLCDQENATHFVNRLLSLQPGVLEGQGIVYLLARSIGWSDQRDFLRWAEQLNETNDPFAAQAYGELITLRSIAKESDDVVSDAVDRIIDGANDVHRCGAAHSSVHNRKDVAYRRISTDILCRLCQWPNEALRRAIVDVFRVESGSISTDNDTKRLLQALHRGQVLESRASLTFLVEALVDLVSDFPEEVCNLAFDITRYRSASLNNMATGWALDVGGLITVALMLQRQGEPLRSTGMSLFEELLRLEAYGIDETLDAMDGINFDNGNARPRRLRRRKRKKKPD